MRLCEMKGRFLFEADPFLFGKHETRVTTEEIIAWGAYYEMENENRKNDRRQKTGDR